MARTGIKWISAIESVLIAKPKESEAGRVKVAAFDLDSTLIETKSGRVYAKDEDDWQWWDKSIPGRMVDLYKEGYKIVVFSNQNGLRTDQRINGFKHKVTSILSQVPVPVVVLAALLKDKYRKPMTGMWEYLEKEANEGVVIDREQSFYVGDAAGRAKGWKQKARKDHSCGDRKFADNIGIRFHTPEEYFLKEPPAPFSWGAFHPREYPQLPLFTPASTPLVPEEPFEVIVLVGYPACGKSSFAKKHLVPKGYHYINQDILKSKAKCISSCEQALKSKNPVVIDNTNPDVETRAHYIKLAQAAGVPVRCFYFTANEDLARHNDQYRSLHKLLEKRDALSGIVFNVFKSKLEKPDMAEGYSEIRHINFVFDGTDTDKAAWKQWRF